MAEWAKFVFSKYEENGWDLILLLTLCNSPSKVAEKIEKKLKFIKKSTTCFLKNSRITLSGGGGGVKHCGARLFYVESYMLFSAVKKRVLWIIYIKRTGIYMLTLFKHVSCQKCMLLLYKCLTKYFTVSR